MDNVLTTCKSELKMAENSVQRLTAERETLTREKTRLSQELQDVSVTVHPFSELRYDLGSQATLHIDSSLDL